RDRVGLFGLGFCGRLGGTLFFAAAQVRRDLDVAGVVDDLDLFVVERGQHVVHLIGSGLFTGQRFVHVVVGEEALALAELDQLLFGLAVCLGARRWRERRCLTLLVLVVIILVTRRRLRSGGDR